MPVAATPGRLFRTRLRWRKLAAVLGVVLGGLVFWDYGDEFLLPTQKELALEDRIGCQIFLGWSDGAGERDRKVVQFDFIHRKARENWDLFDEQFAHLNGVMVDDFEGDFVAALLPIPFLYRFLVNSRFGEDAHEDELVHELAHLHYATLPDRTTFRAAWETISGSRYHGCQTYADGACADREPCEYFVRRTAAVGCYAAHSFDEDVAETVRMIYDLNRYPPRNPRETELPPIHVYRELIPRIIDKIYLASEFGFASCNQAYHATRLLEEYLMSYTVPFRVGPSVPAND
ncbi:MAG: hypothetical protein ISR64_06385 [Deltaproteobacteria bacterium]|nr:hypothetical protein [Deltaproteobacteria bacterium]